MSVIYFFFQAEDGIRDHCVTGVQTCALPISRGTPAVLRSTALDQRSGPGAAGRVSRGIRAARDGGTLLQGDRGGGPYSHRDGDVSTVARPAAIAGCGRPA